MLDFIFSWPLIIICSVLGAIYKYLTWHFDVFTNLGIKGPKPVALLGTMVPVIKKGILQYDLDMHKLYGKTRGDFQGRLPFLVVHDLETIKQIMVKHFDNFTARFNPGIFDSPMDKMVTVVEGDHWRLIRNIITPTFSSGKLRKMNKMLNDCSTTVCKNLEKFAKEKTTFDFRKYTGAYTMDAICSTAFGMKIDSNDDPDNIFVKMARKAFDFKFDQPRTIIFFFFPFLAKAGSYIGLKVFPQDVIDFFTDVFKKAVETRSTYENKDKDFLQLMINAHADDDVADYGPKKMQADVGSSAAEAGSKQGEDDSSKNVDADETKHLFEDELNWTRKTLTNEEIVSNSILFFIAGYETTANTISMLAYNLAIYPDIQEKLYQEIKKITEDGKLEITFDLVQKMTYLDMCINETLRLYPPGSRTDRTAKNDIKINDLFIPKGMNIIIPIYALQNDPTVWKEPSKFDPERFTAEEKDSRDPFSFLPFSVGPRKCIGMRLALMEIKILVCRVLLQFQLLRCAETEVPLVLEKLIVKPANGIKLQVQERK